MHLKNNNNNTNITEPKAIANAFNNIFAKIGNDIANFVPNTDYNPQQYLNKQTYDTFTYSQPQLPKLKLKFLQSVCAKLLDLTVYRRTYLNF